MDLKEKIRVIEDFPKEGISYKDITTLIQESQGLKDAVDALVELVDTDIDLVVGPESRSFIFGSALAYKLNAGFVPIRKPGKLPAETISYSYALEYGEDTLEIHKDAIKPGQKILLIDDLLATGGTLNACANLVESLGGEVAQVVVLIELTELSGREKLSKYNVKSLVEYPF